MSPKLNIPVNYDYIDSTVDLLYTTDISEVDGQLQGFIALCELQFPKRIKGYFLAGSYLDGTAVPSSDLDILTVFSKTASEQELETFWRMHYQINLLSPATLGAAPISESTLAKGVLAYMKSAKLFYGEDIIRDAPLVTNELASQRLIAGGLKLLKRFHGAKEPLSLPLPFPSTNAPYYGFNFSSTVTPDGEKSAKRMVNLVARMTAARLVLATGIQPKSKRDSIMQYKEKVGGSWANFAEDIYLVLNQEQHYLMPKTQEEKGYLEHLCQQMLEFENNFLEEVKPLILAALHSNNESEKAWGLECQRYVKFS